MDSSGENLHGKVINGPWCLKMAFGLILLSFLLSFCYRFVSRKFSPFVGDTYTWSSQKGWRSISSCIRTSGSYSTQRAPLANLTRAICIYIYMYIYIYVDTYIHIHTYVYIYIYIYTCMYIYMYIYYVYIILSVIVFFFLIVLRWMDYTRYKKATCNTKTNWRFFF